MDNLNKELGANELENVTGGGMFWNEYAKIVLHIMDTGARSPLVKSTQCPYCGWKLQLIKKADVTSDEETWAIEKGAITCHSCGCKSPGDAWFVLKDEKRGLLS